MEVSVFFKGVVLGFSIAAPVGPIGVLCIRRTLTAGMLSGVLSGLGAALADSLYGSIAAFGLGAISSLLLEYKECFHWGGSAFLLYLGVKTFYTRPVDAPPEIDTASRLGDLLSALFLTLTNPLTILSFTAIFAGLGINAAPGGYRLSALMVGGVFSGSLLWWIILSGAISRFRRRLGSSALRRINQGSGVIIFIFGLVALTTSGI